MPLRAEASAPAHIFVLAGERIAGSSTVGSNAIRIDFTGGGTTLTGWVLYNEVPIFLKVPHAFEGVIYPHASTALRLVRVDGNRATLEHSVKGARSQAVRATVNCSQIAPGARRRRATAACAARADARRSRV